MKNIQAQYQDLLEGKMSKANFMRNVRMQFPQHISPNNSFEDSVRILKGKRILSEVALKEYGDDSGAQDMTWGMYSRDSKNLGSSIDQRMMSSYDVALNIFDTLPDNYSEKEVEPAVANYIKNSAINQQVADRYMKNDDWWEDLYYNINDLKTKGKGLSEAKQPIGVYGHNPNAEAEKSRGIDHLNYYQVYRGLQYELAKMPEITDENYIKARKKVVDAILKDPDAYKDLQLANFKAVKEMDEDLEMKEVKKNNLNDKPNEMKVVKKDVKGNTQDSLGKKEAKKSKNGKGIQHMTQTPKGKLEAFPTPGKEKTLKEAKEDSLKVLRNLYYFDKLGTLAAKEDVDEKHHKGADLWAKKGDTFKKDDEEYSMILNSKRLKKGTDYDSTSKVQALKEHLLGELMETNPHHESINVGSRVKKKDTKEYDESKVGNVTEFDGDTATVKWDNGSTEHVQINILTKKEIPAPKDTGAFGRLPDLGTVKEDPAGQQAAGNPEDEKEMRDSLVKKEDKIKSIKEKMMKAVKELLYRDQKTQRVQSFKPEDPITKDPEFTKVFKRV